MVHEKAFVGGMTLVERVRENRHSDRERERERTNQYATIRQLLVGSGLNSIYRLWVARKGA